MIEKLPLRAIENELSFEVDIPELNGLSLIENMATNSNILGRL